jgi:signal transduction histidine kinase
MPLDIRTLAFMLGLTSLAQVMAIAIQFRVNRSYQGIGWWLLGALAMALGFYALILGGTASAGQHVRWLGPLGNPLLVFGRVCLLIGTLHFLGRPVRRLAISVAYLAVLAVYFHFLFLGPNQTARIVVITCAIAGFALLNAGLLFSRHTQGFTASARFTGAVFALHAGILVFVAAHSLRGPGIQTYRQFDLVQTLVFVTPAVTGILWTFGFILMVNQRLGAEYRKTAQATAELAARNRQLQKAESLGRMAGAVAHHFNNQLQAVMSNLDLIEQYTQGTDSGPCLARARHATERAAEMSRLMRLYLGQTSRQQEPRFLAELCRESLASLRTRVPASIQVRAELPSPGPVIRANAGQIGQVLGHLTSNAQEALGAAGGNIQLSLRTCAPLEIPTANRFPINWQPQDRSYACLEVRDTGCGIPAADLEKLFDPFFSTKFTGRGLGLPVVLGVVQAHGGAVTLSSRPGHGSVFRLHFPIAEASPGPA